MYLNVCIFVYVHIFMCMCVYVCTCINVMNVGKHTYAMLHYVFEVEDNIGRQVIFTVTLRQCLFVALHTVFQAGCPMNF